MVFHFPLAPDSGLQEAVELSFGVVGFGKIGIDVRLLDMFESGLGVAKQRPILVLFSIVKSLGPGHPFGNVFAIAAT